MDALTLFVVILCGLTFGSIITLAYIVGKLRERVEKLEKEYEQTMAKKAYLVTFSVRTRVVVDVPEELEDTEVWDDDRLLNPVVNTAADKIVRNAGEYIYAENVDTIEEDLECPAGTFSTDCL